MRSATGGNNTIQITKANTSQAFLHPVLAIRACIRIGKVAKLTAAPRVQMAVAFPLQRTNHKDIKVVGIKVREPCPRVRIATKPAASCMG
jgi:hypothetical protein